MKITKSPLLKVKHSVEQICARVRSLLMADVYFARSTGSLPHGALVFFPIQPNLLCCGIAGIVTFVHKPSDKASVDIAKIENTLQCIADHDCRTCDVGDGRVVDEQYLGGDTIIDTLRSSIEAIKKSDSFLTLFSDPGLQNQLAQVSKRLNRILESEVVQLSENMGLLDTYRVDVMSDRIERLKDIGWCLGSEILDNVGKVRGLITGKYSDPGAHTVTLAKKINAVLNSIDRLEVRGRDSAGISLLMVFEACTYDDVSKRLQEESLLDQFKSRCQQETLVNRGISIHTFNGPQQEDWVAIGMTYKVADEIGSLGDNISYLRLQIAEDKILQSLIQEATIFDTISAHTRWASVGAITEPNCHPVDNKTANPSNGNAPIIHTCLNGDIDNFQALKQELEDSGILIPEDITTDTKIIPLQIQKHLDQGHGIEEAFRMAVNEFEGSHAIAMHTDLAPGRIFLAQKGSGQAIFVGLADEHYMPTSEVYGFVEETPYYLKLDGETVFEGRRGPTQGQIFILDQATAVGGLDGITAMYYDGTPLNLNEGDIKYTEIKSRDIDRQGFPHYFLKEISESPVSVEKTLQNRWKIKDGESPHHTIVLDPSIIPPDLETALKNDQIKRIFFIGQGTAGVAALACSNILDYYLHDPGLLVSALKASEFSGFQLNENDDSTIMADALVIVISQSGTTTDTNRTVDMVKERGAYTLAIVNRRDSDITFKVDGVLYTSGGRDIEMSVASTKAFYSQIVAGAILGLYIARLKQRIDDGFVSQEIKNLLEIPDHMRTVLALKEEIAASAKTHAVTKAYWAAVGSGPNKASADEIRIKLSELCYKTISSDFVEDKKHIDLSSEPLIIVCAAGTRNTVIGDIIKDTAIFKAHKATPIVIANVGENRFDPYAETVFQVPAIKEHLAPILNTLVGHIWGYYAALAINDGSRFLYEIQENIDATIKGYSGQGLDIYEIILEKKFQEKIAQYYNQFRQQISENRFPSVIGFDAAWDLTLLLKYLSGRLPVSDFEIDFSLKGTATNMINTFYASLGKLINYLARPVDAIKHQAKTVTVGTSRISDRIEGILFEALEREGFNISQLTTSNILVLKNLQNIIEQIKGYILYRIEELNLLGEPIDKSTIEIVKKAGVSKKMPSRVDKDKKLQGTKRIVVSKGNVYIGKGRKDGRNMIIIPILSSNNNKINFTKFLLLLHISFKKDIPLSVKIKALGGKYENIKNIVLENNIEWDDNYLEFIQIVELFGWSAEKVANGILSFLK